MEISWNNYENDVNSYVMAPLAGRKHCAVDVYADIEISDDFGEYEGREWVRIAQSKTGRIFFVTHHSGAGTPVMVELTTTQFNELVELVSKKANTASFVYSIASNGRTFCLRR